MTDSPHSFRAVVAEKPSVARDIAKALGIHGRSSGYFKGKGLIVTWAVGHLVRLANPGEIRPDWKRWRRSALPMLPENWPLVVDEERKDQFAIVARILTSPQVSRVVCATDAGREGELIFRQIYEKCGSTKAVDRLWVSSLTPAAIRKGFKTLKPSKEFDDLAAAARARSHADWLVGLNLTRAYTLDNRRGTPGAELLSVGRVQTPTLAMLVEREIAIRDFVPEDYIEIEARFDAGEGRTYRGKYFRIVKGRRQTRLEPGSQEAAAVLERARVGRADIKSVRKDAKRRPPPLLYDLTELQRHANRLFGFSAKRTLEIAQKLYERHKAITYPRTDSRHLSTAIAGELPRIAAAVAKGYDPALIAEGTGSRPLSKRFVNDSKVTDHHAILPTGTVVGSLSPGSPEARLLDLVSRRLLQAWHGDHRYSLTTVLSRIAHRVDADLYISQGTAVDDEGWKVLDLKPRRKKKPAKASGKQAAAKGSTLPGGLVQGQRLKVLEAKALKKQTRPPPRFSEGTLLTAMESAGKTVESKELSQAMKDRGIGTPATRASIIETLLNRKYAVRNGKQLRATDKGITLIQTVHPTVSSPAMTGEWEFKLRGIERGNGGFGKFMREVQDFVREVVGNGRPAGPGNRETTASQRAAAGGASPPGARPGRTAGEGGRAQQVTPARETNSRPARPGSPAGPGGGGARATGTSAQPRDRGSRAPGKARRSPKRPVARSGHRARDTQPQAPAGSHADLTDILRHRFGHAAFRPHQEEVCKSVTHGKDVLLVMPTGAGKSLCYQLPGIARGGTTLVVSPLIALMDDQTEKLCRQGFRAERIHSGRDRLASRQVCREYLHGELDFLYIAPERLSVPGFPEFLARRKPQLVAIDEAHCISMWGHDFRPDYRRLSEHLPALRPAPVIALTATATPRVQQDIAAQLGLQRPLHAIHGFRRDNLQIELVELAPKLRVPAVMRLMGERSNRPAIVYAPTRKAAEEQAAVLQRGLSAAAYHAGMLPEDRERIQTAFLQGNLEIIVATIAFGMGIDKHNVRTVVHTGLPGSIEGYYQEIGRAGRDGLPSRAVLLHSWADRKLHEFFLERDYPDPDVLQQLFRALSQQPLPVQQLAATVRGDERITEKAIEKLWVHGGVHFDEEENAYRGSAGWTAAYTEQRSFRYDQLQLIGDFTRSNDCRMRHLVHHFGDRGGSLQPCGQCDICSPGISAVKRFRAATDHENGVLRDVLAALRLRDGLSVGKLFREHAETQHLSRGAFERLVSAAVQAGVVVTKPDSFVNREGQRISFKRMMLTPEGRAGSVHSLRVVTEKAGLTPLQGGGPAKKTRATARRSSRGAPGGSGDGLLEAALRSWRKEAARRRGFPPFRVFSNRALQSLVDARPSNREELLDVPGIGPAIVKNYGAAILKVVKKASS